MANDYSKYSITSLELMYKEALKKQQAKKCAEIAQAIKELLMEECDEYPIK